MNCIDIWECNLNCEYKELTERAYIDYNKIPPDCPYRKSGQIGNGSTERLKHDIETERQVGTASTFEAYLQSEIKRFNDTKSGLVEITTNRKNSVEQTRWVEANLCFTDINNALTILYNELNKLQRQTPTQKKHTKTKQKQFNSGLAEEEAKRIFTDLKTSRFFDDKATLDIWLYICGVADLKSKFTPLNWQNDGQSLGYLITKLFENDKKNYWEIAKNVFTIKGNSINTNSLKNSVSKINTYRDNNPPDVIKVLDTIIAGQ